MHPEVDANLRVPLGNRLCITRGRNLANPILTISPLGLSMGSIGSAELKTLNFLIVVCIPTLKAICMALVLRTYGLCLQLMTICGCNIPYTYLIQNLWYNRRLSLCKNLQLLVRTWLNRLRASGVLLPQT